MKFIFSILMLLSLFANIYCQTASQTIDLVTNKISTNDSIVLNSIKILRERFKNEKVQKNNASNSLNILADKILEKYSTVKNNDSEYAFGIYKDLWEYFEDIGNHEKAIACMESFIIVAETNTSKNAELLLETYSLLANQLLYTGQCDKAIDKVFVPTFNIINSQLNDATSKAEKDFINLSKINIQTSYLFCARHLGDGDLQRAVLKESEKLVKEKHDDIPKYNIYKSDLLGMMASTYINMGDLQRAGIYMDLYDEYMVPVDIIDDILLSYRKLAFYSKAKNENKFYIEFEKFENLYDQALKQFSKNTEEHSLAVNNMKNALSVKAFMLEKLNPRNPKIPIVYHKILAMIKKYNQDISINPLNAYSGLFKFYVNKKQKDSMSFYLEKYKTTATQLNSLVDIKNTYLYTFESYLINNKFEKAEMLLNDYLERLKIENLQQILYNKNKIRDILANRSTIERLVKIANLLNKHEQKYTKKISHRSNQFYLLAANLLNQLKLNQGFSPKEIELLKEINEGILSTREQSLSNDDLVIRLLEGNQSLEMLQKNANKNIIIKQDDVLKALINQREKISREISAITKKYLKEKEDTSISKNENYLNLIGFRDSISNQIKQKYPNYVFYTSPNFDLDTYKNALAETDATLRFYGTGEKYYVYLITKNEVKYYKLGERQKFKNIINVFTNQIKTQKDLKSTINSMNRLLEPVLNDVKTFNHLKIIPHEELSFLPFEILFTDVLKNDIAISYNSSLSLDERRPRQIKNRTNALAVYVPKYKSDISNNAIVKNIERSGNYELPDAFEEAVFISNLFKGNLISDKKASKNHFLDNAKNYNVLHLAMHATVGDKTSNNQAMLLFSGNKEEDYLSLNSIYDLQLSSELVTLSACNTAYGEIDPIEGVLSLSRAFQYAGSKSTLTSLWRVPDKQTSTIMKDFYTNLKNGETKSVALKNAKLNYLENTDDPNLKHPYYWAGFILTGDTSAIIESTVNYWLYIGIAVLMFILIYIIRKRLKTN